MTKKCFMTISGLSFMIAFTLATPTDAGAAEKKPLPLLSEMVKTATAEGVKSEKKKEIFPRTLSAAETRMDITDLLPAGALFYLELPSGRQVNRDIENTVIYSILTGKELKRFFKENPFNLETMLSDLPAEYTKPGIIAVMRTFTKLVESFIDSPGAVSVSAYPGSNNKPVLVFQADIGRDRKTAYDSLQGLITQVRRGSVNLLLQKGDHSDDYIDVLKVSDKNIGLELAYGFIRNFLVVSTDADFLRNLSLRAASKNFSGSLSESTEGSELQSKTSPQSQIRGFINIFALLESAAANKMPESNSTLTSYSNIMNRAPVYYDLQVKDEGLWENITISEAATRGSPSILGRLKAVGRQKEDLSPEKLRTVKIMPYNPDSFYAVSVNPDDLAALLKDKRFMSQTRSSIPLSLGSMITSLQTVFSALGDSPSDNMESEIGLAIQKASGSLNQSSWIAALPLSNTGAVTAAIADSGKTPKKISGIEVYTQGDEINGRDPAWAVFAKTETTFRNLSNSFLVITSSGLEMERTIDSIIGGRAVLATNKDFEAQAVKLKGNRMIFGYENLVKEVQSSYFQLPAFIKELYPKMSGLHAMPRLTAITNSFFGMTFSLTVTDDGDMRLTSWSPTGKLPGKVAEVVLNGPRMIRSKEEWQLLRARKNLAELNLALQEYATQYAHFPSTIHGELGRQALAPLLPPHLSLDNLLINPAALEDYDSPAKAKEESYVYVPGLLPSDIPEAVILYSSRPFHYHYSDATKSIYEPCRLVLTLDGRITTYSEQQFNNTVLPTIKNRQ